MQHKLFLFGIAFLLSASPVLADRVGFDVGLTVTEVSSEWGELILKEWGSPQVKGMLFFEDSLVTKGRTILTLEADKSLRLMLDPILDTGGSGVFGDITDFELMLIDGEVANINFTATLLAKFSIPRVSPFRFNINFGPLGDTFVVSGQIWDEKVELAGETAISRKSVPEPGSLALLSVGLLTVAVVRKKLS